MGQPGWQAKVMVPCVHIPPLPVTAALGQAKKQPLGAFAPVLRTGRSSACAEAQRQNVNTEIVAKIKTVDVHNSFIKL